MLCSPAPRDFLELALITKQRRTAASRQPPARSAPITLMHFEVNSGTGPKLMVQRAAQSSRQAVSIACSSLGNTSLTPPMIQSVRGNGCSIVAAAALAADVGKLTLCCPSNGWPFSRKSSNNSKGGKGAAKRLLSSTSAIHPLSVVGTRHLAPCNCAPWSRFSSSSAKQRSEYASAQTQGPSSPMKSGSKVNRVRSSNRRWHGLPMKSAARAHRESASTLL
mmetsp:Transcript_80153/g.158781  ORF Transcript_80153/g.158781 Transcript_80153/m.158781 type:complete len:221 (-) Transcript_80153:105-767(-)